jgi:hypothetical protein
MMLATQVQTQNPSRSASSSASPISFSERRIESSNIETSKSDRNIVIANPVSVHAIDRAIRWVERTPSNC